MIVIWGELYSSKNHTRILTNARTGKPFVTKAAKTAKSEPAILMQLNANRPKWNGMVAMAKQSLPLMVQFKIYRRTNGVFDYANIIQSLSDLMVKAKYLQDDRAQFFLPVFVPFEVDKHNPRVEIKIL